LTFLSGSEPDWDLVSDPDCNSKELRVKICYVISSNNIKVELGELEFYFRKIPLHQQKFLVVSVLSNLPWLPRNLKNGPK